MTGLKNNVTRPSSHEGNEMTTEIGGEMTEKELERAVRDLCRLTHWLRYHTYRSQRSPAGFPDETLVRDSRLVFAELKSAKGVIKPPQVEWLDSLVVAGQEVYLWRPAHLDEIAAILSYGGERGDYDCRWTVSTS